MDKKTENTARPDTAEDFAGSVFRFSVPTFANIILYGIVFFLTNFFVTQESLGLITLFTDYTGIIMTVAVLGLDQALMRFYHETPNGVSAGGLFRHCIYFSGTLLLLGLLFCGVFLPGRIYSLIGFDTVGLWAVPLLFLNAAFFMTARYFNILFRMEMNIQAFIVQSIAMQFFYRLFFLAGAFFPDPKTAMILCSAAGLGVFAAALVIIRHKILCPRAAGFSPGVYKTVLPFGAAAAPAAIFVTLNGALPKSIITSSLGLTAAGQYAFAFQMSGLAAMIQGGFAAFWAPYMYKNYKTRQETILKVHDFTNFIILVFFSLVIAFEDVLFWVFGNYASSMPIFPLMMLSSVFLILNETTVYGNAIARRPVFDTIGIGLGAAVNFLMCAALIPRFGLTGAAIAIATGNCLSFLFRTVTGQIHYRSIRSPIKTAAAVLLAAALAATGTAFSADLFIRALCSLFAVAVYCVIYRAELARLVRLIDSFLKKHLKKQIKKA